MTAGPGSSSGRRRRPDPAAGRTVRCCRTCCPTAGSWAVRGRLRGVRRREVRCRESYQGAQCLGVQCRDAQCRGVRCREAQCRELRRGVPSDPSYGRATDTARCSVREAARDAPCATRFPDAQRVPAGLARHWPERPSPGWPPLPPGRVPCSAAGGRRRQRPSSPRRTRHRPARCRRPGRGVPAGGAAVPRGPRVPGGPRALRSRGAVGRRRARRSRPRRRSRRLAGRARDRNRGRTRSASSVRGRPGGRRHSRRTRALLPCARNPCAREEDR
jgi:hypothetical protein